MEGALVFFKRKEGEANKRKKGANHFLLPFSWWSGAENYRLKQTLGDEHGGGHMRFTVNRNTQMCANHAHNK